MPAFSQPSITDIGEIISTSKLEKVIPSMETANLTKKKTKKQNEIEIK